MSIGKRRQQQLLLAAAVLFVLLNLLFLPSYFASIDEHEYLRNAFLLQKGTLVEPDPAVACTGDFNGEGYVNQFFIGRSLFLIPFTWFGFHAVLLSGLVIHLLNFFIFYRLLERLQYNRLYALFYLLFPAFVWASRTLNSELLALTGILAGTYFYLSENRRDHILAGLFFGCAILARYEAALLVSAFYLIPLLQNRPKLIRLIGGVMPILLFILYINQTFYGGFVSTGYGEPTSFLTNIFRNERFFDNMVIHIAILTAVYPFMIFAPLLKPMALRKEMIIGTAVYLVFYSFNSDPSSFPLFSPVTLTGRIRYLIPLAGLLILASIPFYRSLLQALRLPRRMTVAAIITGLALTTVAAAAVHGEFLDGRAAVFDQIYAHTTTGALLIGSGDDCNYVLNEFFDDRRYLDVYKADIGEQRQQFADIFVMDIFYSTVDPTTHRGRIAARSREYLQDFVDTHHDELELVFATETPHHVRIYTVKE